MLAISPSNKRSRSEEIEFEEKESKEIASKSVKLDPFASNTFQHLLIWQNLLNARNFTLLNHMEKNDKGAFVRDNIDFIEIFDDVLDFDNLFSDYGRDCESELYRRANCISQLVQIHLKLPKAYTGACSREIARGNAKGYVIGERIIPFRQFITILKIIIKEYWEKENAIPDGYSFIKKGLTWIALEKDKEFHILYIEKTIGEGAFGYVQRVYNVTKDCFQAMKVAKGKNDFEMTYANCCLESEVKSLEEIHHRGCSPFVTEQPYFFSKKTFENSYCYLTREYEGSLDQYLKHHRLSFKQQLGLSIKCAQSVFNLLERGIYPSDLALSNILFKSKPDDLPDLYISDFASTFFNNKSFTTLCFNKEESDHAWFVLSPPHFYRHFRDVDNMYYAYGSKNPTLIDQAFRALVTYAVTVICFQILTNGQFPYVMTKDQVKHPDLSLVPPIDKLFSAYPESLRSLFYKMLDHEPSKRMSLNLFIFSLNDILAKEILSESSTPILAPALLPVV